MKKLFMILAAAGVMAGCSDDNDNGNNTLHITVDFENVPSNILPVDTYGSNFYSDYDEGPQYTEYTDEESGLHFSLNFDSDYSNGYEFYSGGVVFSNLNEDLETNDYLNQCTVNYVDPKTGFGGNKGSKIFAIANGGGIINFIDKQEHLIEHFWAMNTVYATLVMEESNEFGDALSYENEDYFYVTVTGYNAEGTKSGSVDFYLADFRTAQSPGIVKEWTKVDLSSLGKVNKIEFSFAGSDNNQYGLRTPGYVCIDDIAVVKEYKE